MLSLLYVNNIPLLTFNLINTSRTLIKYIIYFYLEI